MWIMCLGWTKGAPKGRLPVVSWVNHLMLWSWMTETECAGKAFHTWLGRVHTWVKTRAPLDKSLTEPQNTDINTNGASSRIGSIRPNMFNNNMREMCSHLSAILCMHYAQHSSILERAKLFWWEVPYNVQRMFFYTLNFIRLEGCQFFQNLNRRDII